MVTRRRLRTILNTLALYMMASLVIGYFGFNAYTGQHGLKAQQNLEAQIADLTAELDKVRGQRVQWERRIALLRSDRIDPDMLDEQARSLLNYVRPQDAILLLPAR